MDDRALARALLRLTLGIYALVYAALIATRSWDRWSLDAVRSASHPPRP